jgi:hypothetical protein
VAGLKAVKKGFDPQSAEFRQLFAALALNIIGYGHFAA